MYKRILVVVDATPADENRSALKRTEQIGLLTGGTVYVLHVARSHIVPGDITGGAGLGVRSAADDVEVADRAVVQAFVDQFSAAGIDAHGEIVSATDHDVADIILQRAKELEVELLVLGHQHHRGMGGVFRSSIADAHHPPAPADVDPAGPTSNLRRIDAAVK